MEIYIGAFALLTAIALYAYYKVRKEKIGPAEAILTPPAPPTQPSNPPPMPPEQPNVDTLVPWTDQKSYYHNVGVLCDLSGLTFAQKDIVRRCIYIESRFRDYDSHGVPIRGFNKNPDGSVWSTDWGVVQINDWPKFGHIGPGCMFSSTEDVLKNPQRAVQYMVDTMKETGGLKPWASYYPGKGIRPPYLDVPTSALDALKS